MRALWSIMLSCTLGACGGARPASPRPPARDDARAPVATAAPAPAAPSAEECGGLVAHVVDLAERERTDGVRLSDADRVNIRGLADARCRAMSRASFACALGATTTDQLQACDDAPAGAGAARAP